MKPDTPESRWWGWGSPGRAYPLPESARDYLVRALDLPGRWPRHENIETVELPPVRFGRNDLASVAASCTLLSDTATRVRHAMGRSFRDLVRLRSGRLPVAPDCVAFPGSGESLRRLLATAAERDWVCVPFGGGTSVVGGVEALNGAGDRPVLTLSMAQLRRVLDIDPTSRTATLEAGIFGPELESALARHALTLGHFPQSFEFSTLGGWVATRSAGQGSTGNGRIDDLVVGLQVDTPQHTTRVGGFPASAAGPDLVSLYLGSEGRLGVIREVTLRLRPLPRSCPVRAFLFRSFAEGCAALREIAARPHRPTVIRLSDETETELFLRLSPPGTTVKKLVHRVGTALLSRRGVPLPGSCLVLFSFEGEEGSTDSAARDTRRALRGLGGVDLGASPALKWRSERFAHPYLRDELLDLGALADTLETCTSWSRLPGLYAAVRQALRRAIEESGSAALVLCHISHLYADGASLYFTFIGRADQIDPLTQWQRIKDAASEAILRAGGTITHHHAVGYEHRPWFEEEVGAAGADLLRAAAQEADPTGILNPGKLLA
ncbi:MAG: FAD-binding oxidoreductase [Gemmatimonadetes bacterium]|nr:FAD-binding oxidoreductase [Gemmatimonadota bacterium]